MASSREAELLEDLKRRTSLDCASIDVIDTDSEEIAEQALPVLVEWVPRLDHAPDRKAVYLRLATPHANPYLVDMLRWLRGLETDDGNRPLLYAAIAKAASERPALVREVDGPLGKSVFDHTELKIEGMEDYLRSIAERYRLRVPKELEDGLFLANVPVDRWLELLIPDEGGQVYRVYLMVEDLETVEVVLML